MYRVRVRQGHAGADRRADSATPTDGPAPLTVQLLERRARTTRTRPTRSRFAWDFDGNGTTDSIDPNPTYTYTTTGVYTAKLTVTDSSGKTGVGEHDDHGRQHRADGDGHHPGRRRHLRLRRQHPVHGHGHRPRGRADRLRRGRGDVRARPRHARPRRGDDHRLLRRAADRSPDDVSHGGNVFGVISASYTDHGGDGRRPALTTVDQNQSPPEAAGGRVRRSTSRARTSAATTDVGGGQQRGSLEPGDWIELNGPFNLLNIDSLTFRVTGGTNGAAVRDGRALAGRDQRGRRRHAGVEPDDQRHGRRDVRRARRSRSSTRAGSHRLFLVFANANTYSLNWVEFGGAGVGTP